MRDSSQMRERMEPVYVISSDSDETDFEEPSFRPAVNRNRSNKNKSNSTLHKFNKETKTGLIHIKHEDSGSFNQTKNSTKTYRRGVSSTVSRNNNNTKPVTYHRRGYEGQHSEALSPTLSREHDSGLRDSLSSSSSTESLQSLDTIFSNSQKDTSSVGEASEDREKTAALKCYNMKLKRFKDVKDIVKVPSSSFLSLNKRKEKDSYNSQDAIESKPPVKKRKVSDDNSNVSRCDFTLESSTDNNEDNVPIKLSNPTQISAQGKTVQISNKTPARAKLNQGTLMSKKRSPILKKFNELRVKSTSSTSHCGEGTIKKYLETFTSCSMTSLGKLAENNCDKESDDGNHAVDKTLKTSNMQEDEIVSDQDIFIDSDDDADSPATALQSGDSDLNVVGGRSVSCNVNGHSNGTNITQEKSFIEYRNTSHTMAEYSVDDTLSGNTTEMSTQTVVLNCPMKQEVMELESETVGTSKVEESNVLEVKTTEMTTQTGLYIWPVVKQENDESENTGRNYQQPVTSHSTMRNEIRGIGDSSYSQEEVIEISDSESEDFGHLSQSVLDSDNESMKSSHSGSMFKVEPDSDNEGQNCGQLNMSPPSDYDIDSEFCVPITFEFNDFEEEAEHGKSCLVTEPFTEHGNKSTTAINSVVSGVPLQSSATVSRDLDPTHPVHTAVEAIQNLDIQTHSQESDALNKTQQSNQNGTKDSVVRFEKSDPEVGKVAPRQRLDSLEGQDSDFQMESQDSLVQTIGVLQGTQMFDVQEDLGDDLDVLEGTQRFDVQEDFKDNLEVFKGTQRFDVQEDEEDDSDGFEGSQGFDAHNDIHEPDVRRETAESLASPSGDHLSNICAKTSSLQTHLTPVKTNAHRTMSTQIQEIEVSKKSKCKFSLNQRSPSNVFHGNVSPKRSSSCTVVNHPSEGAGSRRRLMGKSPSLDGVPSSLMLEPPSSVKRSLSVDQTPQLSKLNRIVVKARQKPGDKQTRLIVPQSKPLTPREIRARMYRHDTSVSPKKNAPEPVARIPRREEKTKPVRSIPRPSDGGRFSGIELAKQQMLERKAEKACTTRAIKSVPKVANRSAISRNDQLFNELGQTAGPSLVRKKSGDSAAMSIPSTKKVTVEPRPSTAVKKLDEHKSTRHNSESAGVSHLHLNAVGNAAITKPVKEKLSVWDFLLKVLGWNASWLQERENQSKSPDVCKWHLPLIGQYNSMDDYYKIMRQLMLTELWEQIYADYVCGAKVGKCAKVNLTVVGVFDFKVNEKSAASRKPDFYGLHCQGLVDTRDKERLKDCDLMSLDVQIKDKVIKYFGFVESAKYGSSDVKGKQTLKIVIRIKHRPGLKFDKPVLATGLYSMLQVMRQLRALEFLPKSQLARDLLKPINTHVFTTPHVKESSPEMRETYNSSQHRAIQSTVTAILEPWTLPRICLLQGPPGSGKSRTIVGIIAKLFKEFKRQPNNVDKSKLKLLVCAPSNAGVDELLKRLIDYRRTQEKNTRLKIIRIGSSKKIHPSVVQYSLENITQMEFDLRMSKGSQVESIEGEKNTLVTKINTLKNTMEHHSNDPTKIMKLRDDIKKLESRKNWLGAQQKKVQEKKYSNLQLQRIEDDIRRSVIINADVICCTLNCSGNDILIDTMKKNKLLFSAVIVDEAAQSTEVDCLVPLQTNCSKLVLVGDPEQLQPTVLSKVAANMNFGQSLFERFYTHFKYRDDNPIMLLDTQYRMHPEIAAFPSRHTYSGKLKTDPSVSKRKGSASYPLKPYLLFNLLHSREQSDGPGQIFNREEADCIRHLCHGVEKQLRPNACRIGIITPYQCQKTLIENRLKVGNLTNIEVNTVDGFQGREKDIIIISCVRACSEGGKIGFLANPQRLNVALTRAKFSLFVVGHFDSLKVNNDWKALIDNGRKRKLIVDIREVTENVADHLLKKKDKKS